MGVPLFASNLTPCPASTRSVTRATGSLSTSRPRTNITMILPRNLTADRPKPRPPCGGVTPGKPTSWSTRSSYRSRSTSSFADVVSWGTGPQYPCPPTLRDQRNLAFGVTLANRAERVIGVGQRECLADEYPKGSLASELGQLDSGRLADLGAWIGSRSAAYRLDAGPAGAPRRCDRDDPGPVGD